MKDLKKQWTSRLKRFFIKEYSLKIRYQPGTMFLMVSLGVFLAGLFAFLLGRTGVEQKKKEQIKALMMGIIAFIFAVFWMLAGPAVTLCLTAVMGLFALYGWYDNRRKNDGPAQQGFYKGEEQIHGKGR